jgi:hypothetical protein
MPGWQPTEVRLRVVGEAGAGRVGLGVVTVAGGVGWCRGAVGSEAR